MNMLDQLEENISGPIASRPFDAVSDDDTAQLVKVARAAQKIDLRVQDIPAGPTRVAIQELHLALNPLLEELPE